MIHRRRNSVFGNRNISPSSAAYSDFVAQTLAGIPNDWGRVAYMSELLQGGERHYAHWGMEQTFGRKCAEEAMSRAHLDLIRKVLGKALPELVDEVVQFATAYGLRTEDAVSLVKQNLSLWPPVLTRSERLHVDLEIETLEAITAHRHRDA
jgi:hypothetical protein